MCEAEEVEELGVVVCAFSDLYTGRCFEWEKSFSEGDTRLFSRLSGDKNSIHLSHEAAVNRGLGGTVVHAARVLGEISRACGSDFFVPGVVVGNLEAEFKRLILHEIEHYFVLVCHECKQLRTKKEVMFVFSVSSTCTDKLCITGKVRLCFP